MDKLIKSLSNVVQDKFEKCGYDREYGNISVSNRPDLCQFQCNGALPAGKKYKKAPLTIANDVLEVLKGEDIFESVVVAPPGFINIIVKDSYITSYINDMYSDDRLGCSIAEYPMTIVVDYGGANIAKPLHVGHLRPAIIGESIKRIARFLGHNVIGDVHLGDWGLPIGMVISEVKRRHPNLSYFDDSFMGEYPIKAPFTIDELEEIYPAASAFAKSNEEAMEEAQRVIVELQKCRRGYYALWKHIVNVSVADLKKNYGNLNVEFDLWKGESDCQEYIEPLVNYLNEGNYTYRSEGALVVDVVKETDKATIPPIIILKSDGAALYGTTDLATIWQRIQDYKPNEIVYVVDKRQGLHFEQVFRCAKKTKIASNNLNLQFIGFGTMNGKDGKPFKTRDGGVMRLQELITIINDNVKDKLKDNENMTSEEREEISRKVGLVALKYGDLSNIVTKDYIFDIEKFASFEGNTGPYLLYTMVRIKSILKKAKEELGEYGNVIIDPNSQVERDLMLQLSKFNDMVDLSFNEKAPNKICDYVYELSNMFNRFYHENKILAEDNKEKKVSWLNLITLTLKVLETALELLGMECPDRM